jgi:phosphoadenosine phosphosulfate reductase
MHGVVPPRPSPVSTLQHLEAQERIDALTERYGAGPPAAIVTALVRHEFPGRVAVVSSFGAESAVLLHLVAGIDSSLPVIFLDTLRHFQETLDYQRKLSDHLGLFNVIAARPDATGVAAEDPANDLAARDPDRCCHVRKTLPMIRALRPFDCLLTGRKRFQSDTRAGLPVFESQDRWIKANPLAAWDRSDLENYFARFNLPRHPLEAQGYPSVGCAPCTRAVAPGEDARAGRWAGHDKTECGIHLGLDGTLRRGPGPFRPGG